MSPVTAMQDGSVTAAPVRVESLQVIGAMATCHFTSAIAPNIAVLESALQVALKDTDESIRLHAARAVESIGLAMNKTWLEGVSNTYNLSFTLRAQQVYLIVLILRNFR